MVRQYGGMMVQQKLNVLQHAHMYLLCFRLFSLTTKLRSCDRKSQAPKRPRTHAHRTHVSKAFSHAHRTRASVRARVRVRIFFRNSQIDYNKQEDQLQQT